MMVDALKKGTFFTRDKIDHIIEASFDILENVGIKVKRDDLQDELISKGYVLKGERLVVARAQSSAFLDYLRDNKDDYIQDIKRNRSRDKIRGALSGYMMNYKDHRSGEIVQFTQEGLARNARLVEGIGKIYPALIPTAPGYPMDVHGDLEAAAKYMTSARYCSGELMFEPTTVKSSEYLFEMADVVGQEINRLPIYPVTPLIFGGDALDIVIANKDRLKSAYVFSMPMVGLSSPMSISMSYAMILAEVLGCGLFARELTGLDILIKPDIFPLDMRRMNYSYGSPEKFVYQAMSADFLALVIDAPINYHSTNIHSLAKQSTLKMAIEKSSMIMAGAMKGATKMYCIGALGLDEVFCPIQTVIDLEIIKRTQRLMDLGGLEDVTDNISEYIGQYIDQGFLMSDLTLSHYTDYHEYSNILFEDFSDGGMEQIRSLLDKIDMDSDYSLLDSDKERELDRIFKNAMKQY